MTSPSSALRAPSPRKRGILLRGRKRPRADFVEGGLRARRAALLLDLADQRPRLDAEDLGQLEDRGQCRHVAAALQDAEVSRMHPGEPREILKRPPALPAHAID